MFPGYPYCHVIQSLHFLYQTKEPIPYFQHGFFWFLRQFIQCTNWSLEGKLFSHALNMSCQNRQFLFLGSPSDHAKKNHKI